MAGLNACIAVLGASKFIKKGRKASSDSDEKFSAPEQLDKLFHLM